MNLKIFFSFIFFLIAVLSLVIYWFIPLNEIQFKSNSDNSNFILNNSEKQDIQFYENMRYPNLNISYKIKDCNLQKQNDMKGAFEILSNRTILEFYPVKDNEEISITCNETNKMDNGLFIAGEGGPTNITKTKNFNVILHGKVLLIKDSNCPRPNVALHELLHALGFAHSKNTNNIMYNVSKCSQTLGEDIPILINKIYSVPNYADISLENVSAIMKGRYLDLNLSVRNNGLKKSENATMIISADNKTIKEINLSSLEIGHGTSIFLTNFLINQIKVNEIKIKIKSEFNELDKSNNKIVLQVLK